MCRRVVFLLVLLPFALAGADEPKPVKFCGKAWPVATTTGITCYEGRTTSSDPAKAMDLGPLVRLTHLESLVLVSGEIEFILRLPIKDPRPLGRLEALRSLSLGHTSVADLAWAKSLVRLEELSLHASPVRDVSALKGLKRLVSLDLSCTKVTDISALRGLKALEKLDLTTTKVRDISVLASLKRLRWLGLSKGGPIGETQREALRKALPKLRITEGRRY